MSAASAQQSEPLKTFLLLGSQRPPEAFKDNPKQAAGSRSWECSGNVLCPAGADHRAHQSPGTGNGGSGAVQGPEADPAQPKEAFPGSSGTAGIQLCITAGLDRTGYGQGSTHRQLQRLVEQPVAFAVQVRVGAAGLGHADPRQARLLWDRDRAGERG